MPPKGKKAQDTRDEKIAEVEIADEVADTNSLVSDEPAATQPVSPNEVESVTTEDAKKAKKSAPKAASKKKAAKKHENVTDETAREVAFTETSTSEPVTSTPSTKRSTKAGRSTSSKSTAENTAGRGRKYYEAAKLVDRSSEYSVSEAVRLVKDTSTANFDATVEIHFRLGVDPRKAEQNIRGTVKLPAGTGKTLRVLAFVPEAQAAATKKAGADYVADDDLKKRIADGWAEFDVAVATPDQMVEVAKLGKVLGPKGLMPNPKAGTVSPKPAEAIAEVKKGTIEYRLAKDGTVHAGVGKVSFSEADLAANLIAYYQAIHAAKPSDLKGTYVRSVAIASTMGPSIRLSPESLRA